MDLSIRRMATLEQVRAFVESSAPVDYQPQDRTSTYAFLEDTLRRFGHRHLGKAEKGVMRRFPAKSMGLSPPQVERLIRQYRDTGKVRDRRIANSGRAFPKRYVAGDIRLLAEVDEAYGQMSGPATAEVLRRQFERFGEVRFERLAGISSSHIYNLRRSRTYRTKRTVFEKTKPTAVAIAPRRALRPDGLPGFARVDTVHQGDRDGRKGIYLVNMVDEVMQYEFVGAVRAISERFPVPLLEGLIDLFPFAIKGFMPTTAPSTSTTASPTCPTSCTSSSPSRGPGTATTTPSSRARMANVVRKHFGRDHIPQRHADLVDDFAQRRLSPFLNYHRPCLFPVEYRDPAGKIRRRYPRQGVTTPYEAFKALDDAHAHLKPRMTFAQLHAVAYAESDLSAAKRLNNARRELFRTVFGDPLAAWSGTAAGERRGLRRVKPLRASSASLRPCG